MNEIKKHQETDVDPITKTVHEEMLKSGAKVWLGLPSQDELKELKIERDRFHQELAKRRALHQNLEFQKLKDSALQVFKKERRPDEYWQQTRCSRQ